MRRWPVACAAAAGVLVVLPFLLPHPDVPDFAAILAPPSAAHPLGTDQLGRDVAARMVAGARLTLGLSVAAVLLTGLFGVAVGLLAGASKGPFGAVLVRTADLLAALPTVLFGLLAAVVLGPGVPALLVAVCAVGWTPFARQAHLLTVRETGREYVEGVVALGATRARVLAVHVSRNIAPPLVAHACLRFASTLLTVSGLSFLGLGVQPPTAEWGAMVAEGREYLFAAPHVVLVPSVAVVLTAAAATVLGRRLSGGGG
ncbi:ABC transporter permease [Pseudonocardia oroxyli]|uniref:Peptide/nickel transport system permease protein n=1 Tax=Pseudonocardia oroxyli TaxID=366584 RepID=A0A1G7G7A6_PSEOR|nr:ABC transporter permease [Pseudonocardia oroxyli]SDE84001.1 peptide/nickel transport system permease protein [Pseudonocardia oroxyli]